MKNSAPEQTFVMGRDGEEEDEQNFYGKIDIPDDGNDSDSSASSSENRHQSLPNSYTTSWPQSYRRSVDLLPNIGFLETPSLSKLNGSSLTSSFTRRHTPEGLPSVTTPLLPEKEEDRNQQRKSSHSLLPTLPRKSSAIKDGKEKQSMVSHEIPTQRQSSYGQAVLNGINVLCGVGILSTPYAVKEGGWAGLVILLIFAVLSYYTGILLRYCTDSQPGLETYPDIGQAAFGTFGRMAFSVVLYAELYGCCVEHIILESDNLSSLFPHAYLNLGGLHLDSHHLFAIMATLVILPTVWLRDLSILSYISAGGVLTSILVVACLCWIGIVDQVEFHTRDTTTLNLATLPVAVGLYGYCYSGHAVFPSIYTSMAKRNQYPSVLFASFGICTVLYAIAAIMGYMLFGDATLSQFTLNMPQELVASKIAVWTTVVNPLTKFALTMSPVAMCLEELIPPSQHRFHFQYSIAIRTALVVSALIIALTVPFFALVMSLIGSFLTMLVALVLPCACYLRILKGKATPLQVGICYTIIIVGVLASALGTYSSLSKIIESLSS